MLIPNHYSLAIKNELIGAVGSKAGKFILLKFLGPLLQREKVGMRGN